MPAFPRSPPSMDILYPLALLLFVAAVPALLYFAYRRVRVLESIVTELQRRPAPGGAAGSGSRPNDVAAAASPDYS